MPDLIPRLDGRTRISEAVVNAIVILAAREVVGVLDIAPLARGAGIGGAVGGIVGFVASGAGGAVVGAVVGVSTGTVAGATWPEIGGHHHLVDIQEPVSSVEVQISARYGVDLISVGESVREKVREAFKSALGLAVERIDVVFLEVEDVPESSV